MNNLHRELAPISAAAWAEIEDEARDTFRANIAGRRVVDMPDPKGDKFDALGTGHLSEADSGVEGVSAMRRESIPVVQLRVPFTLQRSDIDSVDRGATDADWDPVMDAALAIVKAEDRLVFHGDDDRIVGIAPGSSNDPIALPQDLLDFPAAVSKALSALRLKGVGGPYTLFLSADLYTRLSEETDHGNPVFHHVSKMLDDADHIVWAPALTGAVLVSERGGDFELHLGKDLSIGYLSHTDTTVTLYLEETLTFRVNTSEAGVAIR